MRNKINAVIVDDEPHTLLLFRKVIEWFDSDIEIVGEANNLPSAIALINQTNPGVVFLDIEMPMYSGLQINDFFQAPRNFEIVFITAHSDYSIRALRITAFDYLLKPLEVEALKECVNRLKIQVKHKISNLQDKNEELKNELLVITAKQGIIYQILDDILYIQASGMYVVVSTNLEEHIVSKPLKEFEYLSNQNFFRIHRTYIINCKYVKRISSQNGYEVELSSGHKLPIARNRIEDFKDYMEKLK